mgnify:CR=1 FL=1
MKTITLCGSLKFQKEWLIKLMLKIYIENILHRIE